jgi:hypothetical protein
MYLLHNCSQDQLEEILEMNQLRCIININQEIKPDLIDGHNYILYNKKQKKIIGDFSEDLEYEKTLIHNTEKTITLHNQLQKMFIEATTMFECISKGEQDEVKDILVKYPKHIRVKLLDFIELYFEITIPEKKKLLKSISEKRVNVPTEEREQENLRKIRISSENKAQIQKEYNLIMKNVNIGREFIQLLHKYKAKHVNQSNLDMDQLINPSKLYLYLRTHHWKEGIPHDFIIKWVQMKNTQGKVKEDTKRSLRELINALNISSRKNCKGC